MTNTCTCGRPVTAGRTSGDGSERRCLICETAALFVGWYYPAARRQGRTPNPAANRESQRRVRARRRAAAARDLVAHTRPATRGR